MVSKLLSTLALKSIKAHDLWFFRLSSTLIAHYIFTKLGFMDFLLSKDQWKRRLNFTCNIIKTISKGYKDGFLSKFYVKGFLETLFQAARHEKVVSKGFYKERGFKAPSYIIISPVNTCNLYCSSCYADSEVMKRQHLDAKTFHRLISESRQLWGASFVIISGGEPFMYHDGNRDLIDILSVHPESIFFIYTNGTLVDCIVAERLSKLPNVIPVLSIEGNQSETDAIRGEGIYNRVFEAMTLLEKQGVMYGLSITLRPTNLITLLSERFYKNHIEAYHASFIWIMDAVSLGRCNGKDKPMLSEEEKRSTNNYIEFLIKARHYFLGNLIHDPNAKGGCYGAKRFNAFLYIDWNGDVRHCVFHPLLIANIHDIYNEGGTINDLIHLPVMQELREAQALYRSESPTVKSVCPIAKDCQKVI